ncbi:hypothetical protein [Herbaspirillum rubrisubalbicans]|uniref:AzlD domain-containing protein n=1 Tax=Herbaspirillum rubrisubalbicans TaxID=80842 RepID=A0AAD0UB40_9BURK|nr:hypothetical protein [Herbaspirillum rubrisubalbicans]AYR25606.1 hypothetical protein RC54_18060 [Herbaspirillum rubrisubalbicans]
MNFTSNEMAICALSMASVMVRVLPVLLPIRFSKSTRSMLERELPLAVFLNFSVYIVWAEIQAAPVPAIAAIAVAAVVTLSTRLDLILITALSTAIYGMAGSI